MKYMKMRINAFSPALSNPRQFTSCSKIFLVSRLFRILAHPSSSIVSLEERINLKIHQELLSLNNMPKIHDTKRSSIMQ